MYGCWFFIFMSKSHNDPQFGVGLDQPLLVHWKAFIVQAPNIRTASWDEQWPVIRSRTCLATRSSSVHDFYRSSFVCSNVHDYCLTCLRSSFLCGMISSPSFLKPSMVGEPRFPCFSKCQVAHSGEAAHLSGDATQRSASSLVSIPAR